LPSYLIIYGYSNNVSSLINIFDFVLFFTAKTQGAQRKDAFLLPLRGRQKKKINRYAIFFTTNAHRAWFLLFSVLSTENNKINNLSGLCDSNERSEWAVSYGI
jgi:hypothetical protein